MTFGSEYSDLRPNTARVGVAVSMRMQRFDAAFSSEGAFEEKFLLPHDAAAPVREWAMTNLSPDPHGSGPTGAYEVRSLYLDTPQLASYHRTPEQPVARFRVRRYGSEPVVHLERKLRRDGHVRKQRTTVPLEDLRWLNGHRPPLDWEGYWFAEERRNLRLQPVCAVSYLRHAWLGEVDRAPIRLTLDEAVSACPQPSLIAPETAVGGIPLWDSFVLEIKCAREMPRSLREVVKTQTVSVERLSKYCRAVERSGLIPGGFTAEGAATPVILSCLDATTGERPLFPEPRTMTFRELVRPGGEPVTNGVD